MFAIVDIETTGGHVRYGRITEIAILHHDGEKVTGRYETLINPQAGIPWFITQLTGIDDRMVSTAPLFYEVAREVVELTRDRIFVAHNSKFDYGFLQHEFSRLGYAYLRDTLCTCTLSRKFFPGLTSYGLDHLCRFFNIENQNRHRAAGDAQATAVLFEQIIRKTGTELLLLQTIPWKKASNLPPSIPPEKVHGVPHETGIYFFRDESGNIVYVGKAVNLNQRIVSHFSGARSGRISRVAAHAHSFDYEITGSELIAILYEMEIIKKIQPALNHAKKTNSYPYAIYCSESNGYLTLKIGATSANDDEPVMAFSKPAQAYKTLDRMHRQFELCPVLCGLEPDTHSGCLGSKIKQCRGACRGIENPHHYNERVRQAIASEGFPNSDMLLIDKGRVAGEQSAVLIRNGRYSGYGYFQTDFTASVNDILNCIQPKTFYPESTRIIRSAISRNQVRVIELNSELTEY